MLVDNITNGFNKFSTEVLESSQAQTRLGSRLPRWVAVKHIYILRKEKDTF